MHTAEFFHYARTLSTSHLCTMWRDRLLPEPGPRPLRLLVVDDNATAAEALSMALVAEGFDTRYALGGVEALQSVGRWVPDVVVLDINMPEYDGFETAHLLRSFSPTRDAGIIAFTALSESDVSPKGIEAGIDGYCQKGCSPHALIALINGMVPARTQAAQTKPVQMQAARMLSCADGRI